MMTYLATGNIVLKPHLVVVCNECQWEVFRLYRANFQASKYWDAPKTMACINAIAADMDEEAEILSTSLYQMFQNLVQNNRKRNYKSNIIGNILLSGGYRSVFIHPGILKTGDSIVK